MVAQGRLKQRSFTDKEGNNRTSIELDVYEIGPSLKYATAKPNKVQRGQGGRAPHAPQGEQWGAQNTASSVNNGQWGAPAAPAWN